MGAGSICMVCHQSRRGLRDDAHPPVGTFFYAPQGGYQPAIFQGPHDGTQADTLMGRNAYFLGAIPPDGFRSKHATAVGDSCFGCHGKYAAAGIVPTVTNHSFLLDSAVCTNCHGNAVSGDSLANIVTIGMADILKAEGTKITSLVASQVGQVSYLTVSSSALAGVATAYGATVKDCKITPTVAPVVTNPTSVSTVSLAFSAPQTISCGGAPGFATNFTVDQITVSLSSWNSQPKASFSYITNNTTTPVTTGTAKAYPWATTIVDPNGVIGKTVWNYGILANDGSGGAHNPSFILNVIEATKAALQ
jgi:hypothetical protein